MKIQPNILFMMADDHASKAISAYGYGINKTPNIDRLGLEGARLDHCYVTNSICTPSRATILTGTHSHVNGVFTLDDEIDNRRANVAKVFQMGGYETAMIGKWHLGEGEEHCPTGFDYWSVVPGQGDYWDPTFIDGDVNNTKVYGGYAVDIVTNKALDWLEGRNKSKPFFLMYHQKAPHRSWEYDPKYIDWYTDHIALPDTFSDDYKHRAKAAGATKMRVADDMTYFDLGLVQPEGGHTIGELFYPGISMDRKVPNPKNVSNVRLMSKETGEVFTFKTQAELADFKFQRYMQRYLRTVQSVDDNVGRMLDYLDEQGLTNNTLVIYTSDQGMFLGEHGWFDKRLIYEPSFQMPFLIRHPPSIPANSTLPSAIVQNVDFASTMLDFADLPVPSYMQGHSFKSLLTKTPPQQEDHAWDVAYHRYWMHADPIHNAYAHYGIRTHRYKLIFWYNLGLGLPGTSPGGEEQEWELFDLREDPMELFNVYAEDGYADVAVDMKRKLEAKMEEIGDVWVHDSVDQVKGGEVSQELLRAKREMVNH